MTGNSWGCKKVSGYKTIIFFGLVATYWDRPRRSIFTGLHELIGLTLSQTIHKLLKSYPQINKNTACILIFYKNPKKNSKPMIYIQFIFVELEINVWITIRRCRGVAEY